MTAVPLVRTVRATAWYAPPATVVLMALALGWSAGGCAAGEAQAKQPGPPDSYWWHRYPTFGTLSDPKAIRSAGVRLVLATVSADPAWGPYGQFLFSLPTAAPSLQQNFRDAKRDGVRWITWVEAFGDCVMYAGALERGSDGSFVTRRDPPGGALLRRNAWNWESQDPAAGETYRWVGIHNTAVDEDFVQPLFSRESTAFPTPQYPDGRAALGWIPDREYPVSAQIYDACCAKDINGNVDLSGEGYMSPKNANTIDPATGARMAPTTGLYPLVIGPNELGAFPGRKLGDIVYVSHMAASKDPACPFWPEYARVSVRRILADGLDGLWCDNFACYNNFGMPPIRNAFGDWSEHRFRAFLDSELSAADRDRMGVTCAAEFEVRDYLRRKAIEFGAQDPSAYADPAWCDPRWLDDPIWNAYKVFKQRVGQEALRNFYHAIKDEAARAGRPDFCVAGNDMPVYALGWARDDWLDVVSSEQTPAWWVTTGSRGIMPPPLGKYAVIYRAALEHQKGPYATVWYNLSGPHERLGESTELGKVLAAEAFANSTFLKYVPQTPYAGTQESHAWWNKFVLKHEHDFGRRYAVADVGILYSPDNQLAVVVPGRHTLDHDRQCHSFGHWGFATAMLDAHRPYRVVTDWKLSRDSLCRLQTFVIPFAECLDAATLPVLTQWVRAGGRLVITGPSGAREGTQGMFRRRAESLLEPLVGQDMSQGGDRVWHRELDQGTVVWTAAPVDIEYYLREGERPARLGQLAEMVGPSRLLEAPELPATVGVFLWQAHEGQTLFVDLVNYDFDPAADRVQVAQDLRLRVRLPRGTTDIALATLSPDEQATATAEMEDGWATLNLPRLAHYASVKLVLKQE